MIRRKMKNRVIILLVVALLGVGGAVWVWLSSRAAVAKMFGGRDGIALVNQPSKVEAFRLGPLPEQIDWQKATLGDYPITSGPVSVPASVGSQVAAVLTSPRSYGWHFTAKACMPSYGVRLSFHRGNERVDVMLCFECDILWVLRNGVSTGGEDFEDVRPVLVRAVKTLFPNDPVIQSLDEHTP